MEPSKIMNLTTEQLKQLMIKLFVEFQFKQGMLGYVSEHSIKDMVNKTFIEFFEDKND